MLLYRLASLCFSLLLALQCAQAHAAPIHPQGNLSLCLDVAGGSSANGTPLQIAHCYGNAAQDFSQVGKTLRVLGKCVDVTAGNQAPFTQLQIWDCGDGTNANQQFDIGFGIIKWHTANMCADVPYANYNDGQRIQTYTCNPADKAQWWSFSPSLVQSAPVAAPAPVVASAPAQGATSAPSGGRLFTFVNQCAQTVWVAIQQNGGKPAINPSGFQLNQGQSFNVSIPPQWGGRAWGRTGCRVNGNSAVCDTGDTGGLLQPNGIGGQPTSLVEWTMDGWAGGNGTQDYYDVSHVDAMNLPMGLRPVGGTGICHQVACHQDVLPLCPQDLQVRNGSGQLVNCLSSCTKYQTDDTCCRGAHNTSATCPAPEGARVFKQVCPDAYSYAYDDGTSTWNCTNPTGYVITFCP